MSEVKYIVLRYDNGKPRMIVESSDEALLRALRKQYPDSLLGFEILTKADAKRISKECEVTK
jgi:hypothetical protein